MNPVNVMREEKPVTYPVPDDETETDVAEDREATPTERLRELVDLLEQSQDVSTIRTLVGAQTALALAEQHERLAVDHNAFIARFEEITDRFVAALEDGRAGIVQELGQLIASMGARS